MKRSNFCYELKEMQPKMKYLMKFLFVLTLIAALWYGIISNSIFYYKKPIYKPILGGLNTYDIVLSVGETYHIYLFGINQRVTYQSTDIKVATVNLIGMVRTWRPGTTIIQVRGKEKTLQCRVRVIQLSKEKLILKTGDKKQIYVKHVLFGVKYHSSNPDVATVNCFGTVKAVGEGSATITAVYRGKKLRCKVLVEN